MTGMRRSRRQFRAAAVSAGSAVLVLAGCTLGGSPGGPAEASAPPDASARPTSTPWDPGDVPDPSGTLTMPPAQRGDCPVDPAEPGVITFVVTSDDDTTPVEVTFPVFRVDGSELARRMTQPGPVITVVLADCAGAGGGPWRFFATAEHGSLACALFFGGKLVASDSAIAEGSTDGVRADCTGHPGM
jgi:hypothetical protein